MYAVVCLKERDVYDQQIHSLPRIGTSSLRANSRLPIARNRDGVHSPAIRDLLAIAFRRQRPILLSFVGILSGAVLAALLQPKQYEAQMEILVKRARVDPVVTSEPSTLPQFALAVTEEELNSEMELIKSLDLHEQVTATGLRDKRSNSLSGHLFFAIRLHLGRSSRKP